MSEQWIGTYEILEEVGQGSMATVYRARQRDFASAVALKVFSREFAASDIFLARFEHHARSLLRLDHDALVPIYDVGVIDDQPYISMQYMYGGSLAARLAGGPLDRKDVAVIVRRIAAALTYVHKQEVVHHHLSPSDILFDERGDAYLSDVGLAHLLSNNDAAITRAGGMIGTPDYMAPEQASEGSSAPSIDIYALGVTTFQMLSGELPFTGDSPIQILMGHLTEPIPQIDDLPPEVQGVIDTVLSKSPDHRYPSAQAFADQFEAALFGDQSSGAVDRPATISPTQTNDYEYYYPGDEMPDLRLDASDSPPEPPPAPTPKSEQRRPPRRTPEEREGRPTTPLSSRDRRKEEKDSEPPADDSPREDEIVVGDIDSGTGVAIGRGAREVVDPGPIPEQVRFTAFHPREAAAEEWYTFLTYVHLPDLIDQVSADAQKFADEMGGTPRAVKLRDTVGLLRGTELLIVPDAPGLTFKPRTLSLTWDEDIERANFRFKADADLIDQPAIGEVTIFAGPVEIARIRFAIPIVAEASGDDGTEAASADMHERVFISYSHQNTTIVKATIKVLQRLGMEVYADYIALRAGDDWDQRLLEMIEDSDVFQLFWSTEAAGSQAVRREFLHALGLGREPEGARPGVGYIRPVYWEQPMPDIPGELAHIHFMHIPELLVVAERLAATDRT